MDYVELQVTCKPDFRDILIAEAGELGFDSMIETEEGFNAYVISSLFSNDSLAILENKYGSMASLSFEIKKVPRVNWNEEWEKNFEPVIIDGKCAIRASFHKPISGIPYEIIIDPKMSFGTGHHETTTLMVKHQLNIDHNNKRVLDCGCGTGILAILASKLSAETIIGYDIDEWAVENAIQNAKLNQVKDISFLKGTIKDLDFPGEFDLILANINKNILLQELEDYSLILKKGGLLVLSGFYSEDLQDIINEGIQYGLVLSTSDSMNNWVGAVFVKE